MGIDPGSNFMGLGCVEIRGNTLVCIGHTVIHASAGADRWPERLKAIFEAVNAHVEVWAPNMVSAEQVFFAKNAQSALKLGQARGAALAAVARLDIPIHEYSATAVKQTLTGSGRAEKEQVQHMVKLLLGASLAAFGKITRFDASDALALAICHAQHSPQKGIIQAKLSQRDAKKNPGRPLPAEGRTKL